MAIVKKVTIELDGDSININREGLDISDMVKTISALMYEASRNIDGTSVADMAFDATAYALSSFEQDEQDEQDEQELE